MNVNHAYGQSSSSGAPTYGSSTFNPTQNPHAVTMSTVPSMPTETGLDVNEHRHSKRTFDRSASPTSATQGKRMRSNDSQRIPAQAYDWLENVGIEEIAKNFREKTRELANAVGRNLQEIQHRAYNRALQASPTPTPAQLDTPPANFRSTPPAPVKLTSRPQSSKHRKDRNAHESPQQPHPYPASNSLAEPEKKNKPRRNRKIVKCRRTNKVELLERSEHERYQCHRKCGKRFRRKDNWRRHLLTNSPQDGWLCMVGALDVFTEHHPCKLCGLSGATAEHFKSKHPEYFNTDRSKNQHQGCGKLILSGRKDHFNEHFKSEHPTLSATHLEELSRFKIPYQGQWNCGFCPESTPGFYSFDIWFDHVANHFENDGKAVKYWADRPEPRRDMAIQHFDSENEDASNEDDDDDGDEDDAKPGPSGTNGGGGDHRRDHHDHSPSESSDDDDENPRGNGSGQQQQSSRSRQAGKGAHQGVHQAYFYWKTCANFGNNPVRSYNLGITSSSQIQTENHDLIRSLQQQSQDAMHSRPVQHTDRMAQSANRTTISRSGGKAGQSQFRKHQHADTILSKTFQTIKRLGSGSYSIVEEVLHRPTQLRCARKTSRADQPSLSDHLHVEVRTLQLLRHKHIVRLLHSFSIGKQFNILLAPVAEVNLAEYLKTVTPFASECGIHLKRFFGCLTSAVLYIHDSSFTHGDIKPANILVTKECSPNVLLCDFGAARSNTCPTEWINHRRPLTRKYSAPEVVRRQSRGPAADIFSLGCVFLEMAAILYSESASQIQSFRHSFPENISYCDKPEEISKWLHTFQGRTSSDDKHFPSTVHLMLDPDPLLRPNAATLFDLFPPSPCCLNEQVTYVSSFDALYALSVIRSAPELTSLYQISPRSTYYHQSMRSNFTLRPEDLDKISLEFSRLTLAQHRIQANIDRISLCRVWIDSCNTSHLKCSLKRRTFTPARLLEISFNPKPMLQLRSLADFYGTTPNYVALSHVWAGEYLFHKFGRNIFENRFVDIDKLPTKFAKAISVCYKLERRYIWVDFLCIDQDDSSEKFSAIREMDKIYEQADLTIALSGHENLWDVSEKTLSCKTNSMPGWLTICDKINFDVENEKGNDLAKIEVLRLLTSVWCNVLATTENLPGGGGNIY